MSEKNKALRLANDLEIDYHGDVVAHEAAAELRRLHAQRDALLEALKEIVAATDSDEWNPVSTWRARAAIKKAEGGQ